MELETLKISTENKVAHVMLNRPQKANALNQKAWDELKLVFDALSDNPEVRVVVLSGEGKHFCSGIDLTLLMSLGQQNQEKCETRKREAIREMIFSLQAPINAIEKCRKPVLAAIHKGCIGGGLDVVSACDMRYCTQDAYFTIKEIDMGMVADLGTLQRLPKLIGEGQVREMAYTGRHVMGEEAKSLGIVNRVYADKTKMMHEVMELAKQIASKSPVSIRGTKQVLNYTRDHSVRDSLEYIANWNAAMLLSEDLFIAFQAKLSGKKAEYRD